MFTVFIDDSGTSTTQPIAIASALIFPATRLSELENACSDFLRDEFIPEFHTSECAAGQSGTPFADWSWQRKRLVCGRIREITKRFAVSAFSMGISKKDYDEIVTGELREFGGRFHYTWAVWAAIRNLDMWAHTTRFISLSNMYSIGWGSRKGMMHGGKLRTQWPKLNAVAQGSMKVTIHFGTEKTILPFNVPIFLRGPAINSRGRLTSSRPLIQLHGNPTGILMPTRT